MTNKIAAVLIRGRKGTNQEVKDTLDMLNLHRKLSCTVVEDNPVTQGMIKKVSSWITYGTINEETHKLLTEKRGEKTGKELKPFFRLHPPRGGFERKGIKVPYHKGGALGNRREHINELLKKMI